jgi:tetratricopeptide (TPR) repeat protein
MIANRSFLLIAQKCNEEAIMKNYISISIFISLFLLCKITFSQNNNIDSLKKVLPLLKDSARIDCLNALSVEYMLVDMKRKQICQACRDTVYYYYNQAYEEAKKLNYIHGIAESFIPKVALLNHYLNKFKEAEKLARQSLKWFELTNDKRKIEVVYFQVGITLFFQYHYEEAAPFLDQSYYWAEKNGNKDWMYNVLGFKYEQYRDIGEYEKAFDAFQKTQQLNITLTGKIDSFYENYVLAELQRRLGNYSTAVNYYRKVIAKMDLQHENIWFRVSYPELFTLNAQFDSARYYYNLIDPSKLNEHDLRFYQVSLGEFYLSQKEYKKALGLFLQGLNAHRKAGDITQVNRALLDIAKAYSALQQIPQAILYAREGLAIALQSHSKHYIRDAYQIFFDIYLQRNETDSAFSYYQKYVTQNDIVASDVLKGKFAAYNYLKTIELLNKEKQLQQQKLLQTDQQKMFLIISIGGILMIGVFLFRNIILKRKNEAHRREIAENELLLQKLENEKTKIEFQHQTTQLEMQALRAQMNPHFIFNSLNSINRFILQNNKTQASEYLTKFSRLVRLILQKSQEALIPLESELESLHLYLELEAVRFDHHFEFNIKVNDDLETDIIKVPPLIIQPYAENAIWHGLMHKEEKGHLEIELFQQDGKLCCKITDDGIGRKHAAELASKSATLHKSMGLKITADRIAMMQVSNNGSSPVLINDLVNPDGSAAGTEVIIKIPLVYE